MPSGASPLPLGGSGDLGDVGVFATGAEARGNGVLGGGCEGAFVAGARLPAPAAAAMRSGGVTLAGDGELRAVGVVVGGASGWSVTTGPRGGAAFADAGAL